MAVRRATNKLSAKVYGRRLVLKLASGQRASFVLPRRKQDVEVVREKRDEAVRWGKRFSLTCGQLQGIRKALTESGYYVRPREKSVRRPAKAAPKHPSVRRGMK